MPITRVFLTTSCLIWSAATLAAEKPGWTPAYKTTFTASCQTSVLKKVYQVYANAEESSLTQEQQQTVKRVARPYLQACECITDKIVTTWSADDFIENSDQYKPVMRSWFEGDCSPQE